MKYIISEQQYSLILSQSYDLKLFESLNESKFWGNAGAGALIIAKSTGRMLIPKRSAFVNEPGTWGTWGGAIDPGETGEEAVRRELYEESGYSGEMGIIPLHVFKHESGFRYYNFLVIVDDEFSPSLNWETERFGWFTMNNLPKPLHFGLKGVFSNPGDMAIITKYSNSIEESKKKTKKVIKEYVDNDIISLKNYLSAPEEEKKRRLAYDLPWLIDSFIDENGYEQVPDDEMEDYEKIEWIEKNNPELFNKFTEYLYEKAQYFELPIDVSEYPSWISFSDNTQIIKNQWLIHLTNDADLIAENGFQYGVDEIDKLGYTKYMPDSEKEYGGYNFAYLPYDFSKYGKTGGFSRRSVKYKYGSEAVIFRASGLRVWHYGDEEYQTLFRGSSAKNIIPAKEGEYKEWAIRNKKTDQIIVEMDSLEELVYWVEKNYSQYHNII